jgi:hypothetical protein
MKEGTIFVVIKFPQPWPPQRETEILSKDQSNSRITLRGTPEGCLLFRVMESQQEVAKFMSQKIKFVGAGLVLLDVRWSDDQLDMRINGLPVKALEEANNADYLVETKEHIIQDPPSLNHPEAAKLCKEWMNWRKARYANPKSCAKKNRRLKTIGEQVAELQNAIASLVDLLVLIQNGRSHMLGHLATELRALVYWNGRNYNPLLLRVAGRFDLPLPVYMLQEKQGAPKILEDAQQWIKTNEPSILKTIPNQKIVDVQEWLNTPIQRALFKREQEETSSLHSETTTAKDLILDTATALGSAHYDEDLPDHLELIYRVNVFGTSTLTNFLLRSATVIIELGRFVLNNAMNKTK